VSVAKRPPADTAPSTVRAPRVSELLFRARGLEKIYQLGAGLFAAAGRYVWAVNGVSFDIRRGETYGLVGESGSGKSTIARTLVQLTPHSAGTIEYWGTAADVNVDGETPWLVNRRERARLRRMRSEVKYVFQDPSSALDPRMTVERILTAGAAYAPGRTRGGALHARAVETLAAVGLRAADLDRRPSEFSGGQRQRISLARALFGSPAALICDEVVSALDVSIQGQILNLLSALKAQYNLTMIFIAHDLTVVSYMADRIGVLYGGSMMEEAPAARLVERPLHPYSRLLYASIPRLGDQAPVRVPATGVAFNPTQEPAGCPFSGRCPHVKERCRVERPSLREISPGHRVACHFVTAHGVP
jgi:peptide/nickel transport system ATP-binding protein